MLPRGFDFGSFMVWTSIFVLVFVVGSGAVPPGPMLLLNYIFFLVLAHAGVIAHEIAHALVARAVGLRVGLLGVGAGPRVVDRVVGGVLVQIGVFLGGGVTYIGATSERWLRLRLLPMYAAGMLLNGAVALTAAAMGGEWAELLLPRMGQRFQPWSAVFLTSVTHVLFSLIPSRPKSRISGVKVRSDGLQLLCLPFHTAADRKALLDANERYDGIDHIRAGRHAEARERALAMLARDPEHAFAKLQLVDASLGLGDYAAARELCVELRAREDLGPVRLILTNNLAWTNVMLGRADLLAEADELSDRAFRRAPKAAYAMGTRGSVLAQLGRLDEATRLLHLAFKRNDTAENRAYNACFLAMIAARRGDAAAALRWIRTAEQLHPTCYLLERARGAVAEPGTSGPLFALE